MGSIDHLSNRLRVVEALRAELLGPSPQGREIDCRPEAVIRFEKVDESYGPWKQSVSGEEILLRDPPCKRYGVGVLYPLGTPAPELDRLVAENQPQDADRGGIPGFRETQELDPKAIQAIQEIEKRAEVSDGVDTDDLDLSGANSYRPSSVGLSFLADFPEGSTLEIEASGGRYRPKVISVAGKERTWWLRSPVTIRARYAVEEVCEGPAKNRRTYEEEYENASGLEIRIEVYSRPFGENLRRRLLTVCLVNRRQLKNGQSVDEFCLFQTTFRVKVLSSSGVSNILPYPSPTEENPDEEEQSLALLYKDTPTYATGHGCAANWDAIPGAHAATSVRAECLPCFETPSVSPDVARDDGSPVEVSMKALASLEHSDDGFAALSEVIDLYKQWIGSRKAIIPTLNSTHRLASNRHMADCEKCAERMREGLRFLRSDSQARRAFQLANLAVLHQQIRSRRQPRTASFDETANLLRFSEPYSDVDLINIHGNRGKWRAFQIAFLLMSVKSASDGSHTDRKLAELIWFPTGGGKTEAYLGLAAYCMFLRRLKRSDDSGVEVIMRYTLRLLTAQQFQRASALICAMESLRRENSRELGGSEFSIGIWVGGDTTPNTRGQALESLKKLNKDPLAPNPFLLDRCPWCGAQMGPVKHKARTPKQLPRVIGYANTGGTVGYACPDSACRFSSHLPVYIIDEDIYDCPPTLIIGTVDKFAMLAWRPKARTLFGIGPDGERKSSPPGLIIQDELHLISGPLGSMVGLYEAAIEELCTDRRVAPCLSPKIVSSTATIRRYVHQIRALYNRPAALFPPPGLDAGDSFFARYAKDGDGRLKPGRMYVGVHGPGLGSVQTAQARTFSSLIQAPMLFPSVERDPWWSLLVFFNSLRELGTTLSLFQSDIPDYLKVIRFRQGTKPEEIRRPWNVRELTGRLRDHEVPQAIADLEVGCSSKEPHPVDVCLASNIIEVGVDIDRLSLMSVLGQPKTTSQYIQVTGRVGRSWWERPGLVVTIYSPSKPRDRSHFEKFRSYHERLYAQVEPASVTPFSPPALDRALHAVMALYARQAGTNEVANCPYPFPNNIIEVLRRIMRERVVSVDPEEATNFDKTFQKRAEEWRRWQRMFWSTWDADGNNVDAPLLREAGAYASSDRAKVSWPTPMSMRNVDAECQAEITQLYLNWKADGDA